MRLALSDDEAAFRDELRELFTTQISEEIRERTRRGEPSYPDDAVITQRILNSHGLAVPNWPVEWGGKDWSPLQRQIWADEMRLAGVPEPLAFNASMVGPVIAQFGSQALKERFLPPTANLDIWWCQGFSEPEAGSDLASLRTTAVRDGDSYVINGQKTWTTLGQYADWIFLLARTDPTAPKRQAGISFLLAEMSTPGITLRPIKLIDGSYEVNEVFFEDVRIPADQLVGEENKGWGYAKFLLSNERNGIARIGATKVALAACEAARRGHQDRHRDAARGSAVRRAAGGGRKLGAGTGTHPVAGERLGGRRETQPGVIHPQTARQPTSAGRDRAACRCGRPRRSAVGRPRGHRFTDLGAGRGAALPELPQDLDLRRDQRGAAHHHRLHHPRIVRTHGL